MHQHWKSHPTWQKTWKKVPRNGRVRMRKVRSWVSNVCSSSGNPLSHDSVPSTLGWPLRRYMVKMRKWLFLTDNSCTEAFQLLERKASIGWTSRLFHQEIFHRCWMVWYKHTMKVASAPKRLEKNGQLLSYGKFLTPSHQVCSFTCFSCFVQQKLFMDQYRCELSVIWKDIRWYESKLGSPLQKTLIFGRLWADRTSVKKGHVIDTWRRYG